MKIALALLLSLPLLSRLAEAKTVAELESFAKTNIAPKIDLMCGTKLDVHYDPAVLKVSGEVKSADLCEATLHWFFDACLARESRIAIEAMHIHGLECRVAPRGVAESAKLVDGKVVVSFAADGQTSWPFFDALNKALHVPSPSRFRRAGLVDDETAWKRFVAAPMPVVTEGNYCEVDGKKVPLSATSDPAAPPTARVRCVANGKVVTDLVPGPGGYTGFSTVVDGYTVVFNTWRNGYRDGESWTREGKVVTHREKLVRGQNLLRADFNPVTGALEKRSYGFTSASSIDIDEQGDITRLECTPIAAEDEVLRGYCGFDKPRKVKVKQSFGTRTYVYDHGQIIDSD